MVVLAAQIVTYFYYLPDEKDRPDSIRDLLMNVQGEFKKKHPANVRIQEAR
jgi:hypothetical protein